MGAKLAMLCTYCSRQPQPTVFGQRPGAFAMFGDFQFVPYCRIGVPRCTLPDSLEGEMGFSRHESCSAGECDVVEVLSYAARVLSGSRVKNASNSMRGA